MTNCNCDAPPLRDIGMMENSGPIFINDFTGFCAADIVLVLVLYHRHGKEERWTLIWLLLLLLFLFFVVLFFLHCLNIDNTIHQLTVIVDTVPHLTNITSVHVFVRNGSVIFSVVVVFSIQKVCDPRTMLFTLV